MLRIITQSLFAIFVLTIHFFSYAQESSLETLNFHHEWNNFLQTRKINTSLIGQESYQEYEYALLDEFSYLQNIRYREYLPDVDRYDECRPYLENKICLSDQTEISASFIELNHSKKEYDCFIASQAPLKNNIPQFWQMVNEKEIDQIVMLTEIFEMDDPFWELAYPYLPQRLNEKMIFENGLQVILLDEIELLSEAKEKVQIRKLKLHFQGKDKTVTHYWYRHWLDGTVPQMQTITALMNVVEEDRISLGLKSPILIHCSAGVGRTGVFIALYHLKQRSKYRDEKIDLFDFIGYLRWQRPYLVGNLAQYLFCYHYTRLNRLYHQ